MDDLFHFGLAADTAKSKKAYLLAALPTLIKSDHVDSFQVLVNRGLDNQSFTVHECSVCNPWMGQRELDLLLLAERI